MELQVQNLANKEQTEIQKLYKGNLLKKTYAFWTTNVCRATDNKEVGIQLRHQTKLTKNIAQNSTRLPSRMSCNIHTRNINQKKKKKTETAKCGSGVDPIDAKSQ